MPWSIKKYSSILTLNIRNFVGWASLLLLVLLIILIRIIPMGDVLQRNRIWIDVFTALGTVGVAIIAAQPSLSRLLFKPKLKVGFDEKIGFVISKDQEIRKIQLGLNFINVRHHDLLVQRIVAEIVGSESSHIIFDWNLFIFDYSGRGTTPKQRPVPIMVKPADSHYEMIQFFREDAINLIESRYTLRLKIWVNQESIIDQPRFINEHHFIVRNSDIDLINKEKAEIAKGKEPRWRLVYIPLEQWDFRNL